MHIIHCVPTLTWIREAAFHGPAERPCPPPLHLLHRSDQTVRFPSTATGEGSDPSPPPNRRRTTGRARNALPPPYPSMRAPMVSCTAARPRDSGRVPDSSATLPKEKTVHLPRPRAGGAGDATRAVRDLVGRGGHRPELLAAPEHRCAAEGCRGWRDTSTGALLGGEAPRRSLEPSASLRQHTEMLGGLCRRGTADGCFGCLPPHGARSSGQSARPHRRGDRLGGATVAFRGEQECDGTPAEARAFIEALAATAPAHASLAALGALRPRHRRRAGLLRFARGARRRARPIPVPAVLPGHHPGLLRLRPRLGLLRHFVGGGARRLLFRPSRLQLRRPGSRRPLGARPVRRRRTVLRGRHRGAAPHRRRAGRERGGARPRAFAALRRGRCRARPGVRQRSGRPPGAAERRHRAGLRRG